MRSHQLFDLALASSIWPKDVHPLDDQHGLARADRAEMRVNSPLMPALSRSRGHESETRLALTPAGQVEGPSRMGGICSFFSGSGYCCMNVLRAA
jgi:hypothetical protein